MKRFTGAGFLIGLPFGLGLGSGLQNPAIGFVVGLLLSLGIEISVLVGKKLKNHS